MDPHPLGARNGLRNMTSAATLYAEAIRYGLEIPQDMRDASPDEREACWNGVGPQRSPLVRRVLSWFFRFLMPAMLIHDWRYWKATGTYHDWTSANEQMERNCWALIRRKLAWYMIWRRPGLVAETEAARVAVDSSEGRKAYDEAWKARIAREFIESREAQG